MGELMDNDLNALILKCNRCGFCQDVCPTYAVSKNEFDVARGRARMMRMKEEGQTNFLNDRAILTQIDQCLLCGACVENCPANVPTNEIMRLNREQILKKKGFSLFHSLVYRGALSHSQRLEKVISLIHHLDQSKIRNNIAKTSAKSAYSLLSRLLNFLPVDLHEPARKSLRSRSESFPDEKKPKVAYFLGCGTNLFLPKVALATINVLELLGFCVDVPDVSCCGGPHWAAGDSVRAQDLARKNIALLHGGGYDYILSDCATCSHTLHEYSSFFSPADPLQTSIEEIQNRLVDINAFTLAHSQAYYAKKRQEAAHHTYRVTYHDPCHAVRGFGGKTTPRQLLKSIPGVEFVEMEKADSCCGGAGSYAFRHPEISTKILEKKVEAVKDTQATALLTSCPSCILQLGSGLRMAGMDMPVMHPMELMAELLANDIDKQPQADHILTSAHPLQR